MRSQPTLSTYSAEARSSVSFDAPNTERGVFHNQFNFALLRRLLILVRPEFIIEMQRPFRPAQPHSGKAFRPDWKLPSFARHKRIEITQHISAVFLLRA